MYIVRFPAHANLTNITQGISVSKAQVKLSVEPFAVPRSFARTAAIRALPTHLVAPWIYAVCSDMLPTYMTRGGYSLCYRARCVVVTVYTNVHVSWWFLSSNIRDTLSPYSSLHRSPLTIRKCVSNI